MSRGTVSVAGAFFLCVAGVADAHHSRALYDMTTEVVFDGTVAKLEWRNPHISMTVETKGADGTQTLHEIEVMSVSEARALGLRREAITEGSHVVVRAHPGRSGPAARAVGLDVTTSDGTRLPLNTDAGFEVAPSVAVEAQGLAGRWAPSIADFRTAFDTARNWPFTEGRRASLAAAFSESSAVLGICADYPPPLLTFFPDLREIEIGDSTVVMRFEAQGQNVARIVHLDQPVHPAGVAPSLLGHSIGRWEGQTLVVDTVAFEPHAVGVMIGAPSGPQKHLVERFTLAEDRRHLRYDVSIEDPLTLTMPASLSVQWEYRPDLAPSGVACDPEAARRVLQR
ncbi:MAG TPA: DUF6152 family protein [Gammaproteobacteria bacterium]|nr:DUF6152 family protein [Gammaproteobacteria bacterium]